ncbi:hypothetical protein, partial [Thiolapillus sp.]|uniref:hypothetical protein n=1 Tax=Thiolapillus sp. TaxID=2017437 RepID=UPI003AF50EFA
QLVGINFLGLLGLCFRFGLLIVVIGTAFALGIAITTMLLVPPVGWFSKPDRSPMESNPRLEGLCDAVAAAACFLAAIRQSPFC